MSDYIRNKAIRLMFPQELLDRTETNNPYECEEYLVDLLGDLFENNKKHFRIETTDTACYLDWLFYHSYGDESGDFGFARYLTDDEWEVIAPVFGMLDLEIYKEDLRLVDYCYYNGSDAPDYYEIEEEDYSEELL